MPRITNSMLVSNYMNNMQRNLNNMSKAQNQLSSGKVISRASDNPYIALRSMQLNAEIEANKQYNTNISDSTNWLDTTDTALGQANNVIKRIKELMIKAGNGSYRDNELGAIKDEITQKVKEFGQIVNTSFDGCFIFSGTKSTTKPVTVDDNGNMSYIDKDGNKLSTLAAADATRVHDQLNGNLQTEISDGVVVGYNVTAVNMMEFKATPTKSLNIMNQLSDIVKCLSVGAGDSTSEVLSTENGSKNITDIDSAKAELNGDLLTNIESISNNLLTLRANVGAMQNKMESAKQNNEDQTYNMTSILSKTEDIDWTEKTMEYSVMQTVYTATLQTSSKVLNNTLLDYVR